MAFGIDDAIAAGLQLINKFVPDPQQKQAAETELRTALLGYDKGQTDTNTAEASNQNLFVSGWRPAVGWVCAFAVAYSYVLVPLGLWLGAVLGHPLPKPPVLDANLWELMFGMLGMAGFRSFEKIKGIAGK